MKITGQENCDLPIEKIKFLELAEITIEASPAELRKIADFLNSAAANMESMGKNYSHEHLSDKKTGFDDSPHFVVFNSELSNQHLIQ